MQSETRTGATPFGSFEISDQGIIRCYQPQAVFICFSSASLHPPDNATKSARLAHT